MPIKDVGSSLPGTRVSKGSWLAAWLTRLGATVAGFSDGIPTEPSHFAAMHLDAHLEDLRGDIRDRQGMVDAVRRFKPEVVFHLAARPWCANPTRTPQAPLRPICSAP